MTGKSNILRNKDPWAVRLLAWAELHLLGHLEQHIPEVAVPGDPLTADGVVAVHITCSVRVGTPLPL